jgi:uncharacterized protein (DUF1501 family)
MSMNRRMFLGLAPAWLARAASSAQGGRRKVLVALFQRGAMDGLNVVIPFRDPRYRELRPTLAVPSPLDLDGTFALHPSLDALKPLWDRKQLAIVHAVGSPDPTRSHFDAQDYMESGTPGRKATRDGWLNRAIPPGAHATPLRAVSMGPRLPRSMRGSNSAVAIGKLGDFTLRDKDAMDALESMYSGMREGRDTFEAMKLVELVERSPYTAGAEYPRSPFGQSLQQIARLIKANVGVEVAFADIGGWDTHTNEAQRLPNLLSDFGRTIAAFCLDLGDRFEDVMLVTMSEFGRTARENGTGGTDHGHASVMFVAGGSPALRGGKVHGTWPGLEREQLYEGRDLAVTTDFRSVLGEVVSTHLGVKDLSRVFPEGASKPVGLLG